MSLIKKEDVIIACADAYREASKTTDKIPVGELSERIKLLSSSSSGNTWQRPSDWPPYVKEFEEDYALENPTFEGVYLMYDTTILAGSKTSYMAVQTATSCRIDIVRGTVNESGVFVQTTACAENVYQYSELLPENEGKYVVYKIIPADPSVHITVFKRWAYGNPLYWETSWQSSTVQPCVEIYGRLPYATDLGAGSNQRGFSMRLVHRDIRDCKPTILNQLFAFEYALECIEFKGWDTSAVTDISSMFDSCISLKSLDLSNLDLSNIAEGMTTFCRFCTSLEEINFTNTKLNGESFYLIISTIPTNRNFKRIITDNMDVSAITSTRLDYLFADNGGMIIGNSMDKIDLSFLNNIQISGTSMAYCFSYCALASEIKVGSNWDTSNITDMRALCYGCQSLLEFEAPNWNVTAVTNAPSLFRLCQSLKTLDLTGWDLISCTTASSVQHMFTGTPSLENIVGFPKIYISFSLSNSPHLTHDSLLVVLNTLPTVDTAQTLTLHANSKSLLSEEDIAIATEKGWTIA